MSGVHAHNQGHDHRHDRVHGAERGALTSRAAMASISMALALVGLKIWAVWDSGSVAMLGSLADTVLDVVASVVTLVAVRYAALPADDEHRFGHGKAEALAALFQVVLISLSAVAIGWRAINRFGSTQPLDAPELGIGVSLVAMAATVALLAYQRLVIRRTGSVAIQADHVHYQSDVLLNGGVIAALLLDSLLGWRNADPLFGLIIAAWLGWGAWRAASTAVDQLMDREWPDDRKALLMERALAHPGLAGLHNLRTRTSGGQDFAQFHVWVDPTMTLAAAHQVMDDIETELARDFPGAEIIIHPEPRIDGAVAGPYAHPNHAHPGHAHD